MVSAERCLHLHRRPCLISNCHDPFSVLKHFAANGSGTCLGITHTKLYREVHAKKIQTLSVLTA
jgi:hypothetical protein